MPNSYNDSLKEVTAVDLIYQQLSWVLNRYLSLDPVLVDLLSPLKFKRINLDIRGLPTPFSLYFTSHHIEVSPQIIESQLTIKGGLSTFVLLGLAETSAEKKRYQQQLELEGDLELAQDFHAFWSAIYIDWEGLLGKAITNPLAVIFGKGIGFVRKGCQYSKESLCQTLSEYLQEESLLLPPRQQVNDWVDDIHELRLAVDRLEAKIYHLETLR